MTPTSTCLSRPSRNTTLHAYWAPWLATWPREVHNPYSFTEAEMDELRATDPAAWEGT